MTRTAVAALLVTAALALGQKDGAVPKDPILCLEPGGPTSAVTCLGFAHDRDGVVLYSAGLDKAIRVWRPAPLPVPVGPGFGQVLDRGLRPWAPAGFALRPDEGLRIPVGPGLAGSINRLAVSPDGEFLAVTGNGVVTGMAGFRDRGVQVIDRGLLTADEVLDLRAVYLFSPARRTVTILREPKELVQGLAFVTAGGRTVLVAQGPRAGAGGTTGCGYAWDVDVIDGKPRGRLRATWEDPVKSADDVRPGLAVKLTPAGTLVAASAWGDGTFRVHEVTAAGDVTRRTAEHGPGSKYVLPVVGIKDGWLTGGGRPGKADNEGYLQVIRDTNPLQVLADWTEVLTPPAGIPHLLPTDFGRIAGGAEPDHIAAVVRYPGSRYGLAVLPFTDLKVAAVFRDALFPDERAAPPPFACSPDGRWVAVTGRGDKEIRVLAAADLVKGRVVGSAVRGAGTDFPAAAFVRGPRDADRGLLLSARVKAGRGRAPTAGAGDLVLDFATRKLAPVPAGWVVDAPAGWTVDLAATGAFSRDPAAPKTRTWVGTWKGPAAQGPISIRLPAEHEVTDFAICPPTAGGGPVLAVATWNLTRAEPLLQVFDVKSGALVRLLAAHTRLIRSVAVTADGRSLVSAADDQTTCVWDLRDLAGAIGKVADVAGVRITERDKRLVVTKVDEGHQHLRAGDGLAAVVVPAGAGPKEVPLSSAADYRAAVWPRAPGQELTFVVDRAGRRQAVPVKLEQVADERKPVTTVFANGPGRQWVAWTPAGTFDAAGPDAERYIGWQFNPPRLDGTVQFAFAEQYREKLRDGRLLKALAGVVVERPRLPRPVVVVSHQGRPVLDAADGAPPLAVATPELKLTVSVPDPSALAELTWALDDGPAVNLLKEDGFEPVADVTLRDFGNHRITVRARTRESNPQEVGRDILVRFQPPRPTLTLLDPKPNESTTVSTEKVTVRFETALADVRKLGVRVLHNGNEVKAAAGAAPVTLVEGDNRIVVEAWNTDVPDKFRADETVRESAVLRLQRPADPEVVLTGLFPRGATAPAKVMAGRVVVAADRVDLLGRVTATEPLTILTVDDKVPSGFVPGRDKVVEFIRTSRGKAAEANKVSREVELRPGENTITVTAATKNSRPTTAKLTIVYLPPPPDIEIQAPAQNLEIDGAAKDPPEFRALVTPDPGVSPEHAGVFTLLVRVTQEGKPVRQGPVDELVFPGTGRPPTVRQALTLRPGHNLIEVRLRNSVDGKTTTIGERRVAVRFKPVIDTAVANAPQDRKTTLTLAVRSETRPTGVAVNGRGRPFEAAPRAGGFTVTVPNVPLEPGPNRLAVVVANADGPGPAKEVTVEVPAETGDERRRASIEVFLPPSTVDAAETPVKFQVTSYVPVAEVGLVGAAKEVTAWKPGPGAAEERVGVLVTEGAFAGVRLAVGVNDLRLVARTTDGAEVEHRFRVTYLPRPVTLTLDAGPEQVAAPTYDVRGTVRWANPGARSKDQMMRLAVHVNGYRQPPPTEVTEVPNGFTFRVPVRFRQEQNMITVELPGTPTESAGRAETNVSCTRPATDPQTLHLLVVAVGKDFETQGKDLADKALTALHARAAAGEWHSRVFDKVVVHPFRLGTPPAAVAGRVALRRVTSMLRYIQGEAGPHDVTLVYWIGRERIANGERYLLTAEALSGTETDLRESAVPLKDLVGDPARGGAAGAGARVVLLDTVVDGPESAADDRFGRAAVLRYAWSRADAPLSGLLAALEKASTGADWTSLETLARVADRRTDTFATRPVLEHNLETREGSGLGGLILTRQR